MDTFLTPRTLTIRGGRGVWRVLTGVLGLVERTTLADCVVLSSEYLRDAFVVCLPILTRTICLQEVRGVASSLTGSILVPNQRPLAIHHIPTVPLQEASLPVRTTATG